MHSPRHLAASLLALTTAAAPAPAELFGGGAVGKVEDLLGKSRKTVARITGVPAGAGRVRRDASKMSREDLQRFKKAVLAMIERGSDHPKAYQQYVNAHHGAADLGHGGPAFLPWHRAYLLKLEEDLREIDPKVSLPYWNWTKPAPAVFAEEFFGARGRITLKWKGKDGQEKSYAFERGTHYDPKTVAPVPAAEVAREVAKKTFLEFAIPFEDVHGGAHTGIGGDLGAIHSAAKDPLFFMLHAYVDKVWADWQQARRKEWEAANPGKAHGLEQYAAQYWDGTTRHERHRPIWDTRHRLDSVMWPWDGTTVKVLMYDEKTGHEHEHDVRSPRYVASPERITPRDMLDLTKLGYGYE